MIIDRYYKLYNAQTFHIFLGSRAEESLNLMSLVRYDLPWKYFFSDKSFLLLIFYNRSVSIS